MLKLIAIFLSLYSISSFAAQPGGSTSGAGIVCLNNPAFGHRYEAQVGQDTSSGQAKAILRISDIAGRPVPCTTDPKKSCEAKPIKEEFILVDQSGSQADRGVYVTQSFQLTVDFDTNECELLWNSRNIRQPKMFLKQATN